MNIFDQDKNTNAHFGREGPVNKTENKVIGRIVKSLIIKYNAKACIIMETLFLCIVILVDHYFVLLFILLFSYKLIIFCYKYFEFELVNLFLTNLCSN